MDSCTWFLELLAADVGIVNSHGWSFISDRQKGLPGAFEDVVRNAEHHFCARHLLSNYIKLYKGKALKDIN